MICCMRINSDFGKRAIVEALPDAWVNSPEAGVERLMLDRIGDEVARATSIVRYQAGSAFAEHAHAKGEEFIVLDGVFSDEHQHYPVGTYVRNPPGTKHSPFSEDGCRILVKLRQFDDADRIPVVIDTADQSLWSTDDASGGRRLDLYQFGTEMVAMLQLPCGFEAARRTGAGGLEWFLISGALSIDNSRYEPETWFRFPPGDSVRLQACTDCLIWQKSGHL